MNIETIMTADSSGAGLVEFANQAAERLVKDNLTRSQIRGIFTEVRKIEALWESKPTDARRRLNMLKPKLDYQAARAPAVGYLRDVLKEAIAAVEKAPENQLDERFKRFMDLFEAILAYHRAQGGRN